MTHATCNKCGEVKSAADMGRNKAKKSGLHHWCLACRRTDNNARNRSRPKAVRSAIYRTRKYGVSPEKQRQMLDMQGGNCAICVTRKAVCLDHCHSTGRARGWLCRDCNTLLRALDTWPHRDRAESYLRADTSVNALQAIQNRLAKVAA